MCSQVLRAVAIRAVITFQRQRNVFSGPALRDSWRASGTTGRRQPPPASGLLGFSLSTSASAGPFAISTLTGTESAPGLGPDTDPGTAGADGMAANPLIVERDWETLGQHLAAFDEQREAVIKRCRDVQKLAKQAVYSLHRNEIAKATDQLTKAEGIALGLLPALAKYPALRLGSFSAAVEEYAEAMAFSVFLREGRLIRSDELPLAEPEEFLGGVLDFTGELNRYSIARATVRDKAAVQQCRDLVDAIMGRFLLFDLRNGSLRKKYDGLKYTLKKMESTLYELALTDAMGFKVTSEAAAMEPEPAMEGGGEEAH